MSDTVEVYQNGELIHSEPLIDGLSDIEREYQKYLIRKEDGERMFLELASELRLAKASGAINEQVFNSIEDSLIPVRNEVIFGQWRTGLRKLEDVGSVSVGVDLYNRIHQIITTYITSNY